MNIYTANKIDPMGKTSPLPMDIKHSLFKNLKTDLPKLAQVCKWWKNLIDGEEFREMIRPANAFGSREWNKYIRVEVDKEPRLPLWAYGSIDEKGEYMLTFIPDKVTVAKEDGTNEEVALNNLKTIGILNERTGLTTGYNTDGFPDYLRWLRYALKQKRLQEKPHWVWIKKEAIGRNMDFDEQQALAKERRIFPG